MKPVLENVGAGSLYATLARCRTCGTTRPVQRLVAGVCDDDWHQRLQELAQSLPKKRSKSQK